MSATATLRLAEADAALAVAANYYHLPSLEIQHIKDNSPASTLTLSDDSTITGPNTIATFLASESHSGGEPEKFDKAVVQQWLSLSTQFANDDSAVEQLNMHLESRTYILENVPSVADIMTYARLHPILTKWDKPTRFRYQHVTRWFDFIQHDDKISNKESVGLGLVEIDLNAPKIDRKEIPKGAKDQTASQTKQLADQVQSITLADKETDTPDAADKKRAKKEQKEKEKKDKKAAANNNDDTGGGGGGGGKSDAAKSADSKMVPSMVDLRVGHIVKAVKHPDADSLYVSTVDLGESTGPRTVVSGLVKYIPLEAMQDRRVVCVCNLKPVAMRGVKSHAMVLAASPAVVEGSNEIKDHVELVQPPSEASVGEKLSFEGFESGEPEAVMNPKKKIWETIQPGFTTDDSLQVGWTDTEGKLRRLKAKRGGVCKVESIIKGTVR